MTFSEYLASSFDQSLIAEIRRHYLALLLGPIIVALLFYALSPELPGMYVSKAYVRLDRANAESLSLERTKLAVANLLLGGLPEIKEKSDSTRTFHLTSFMELVDAEPPGSTATERLYRLEMTQKDPAVAQSINRQMLEGWLATIQASTAASLSLLLRPSGQAGQNEQSARGGIRGNCRSRGAALRCRMETVVSQFAGMALRTGITIGRDALLAGTARLGSDDAEGPLYMICQPAGTAPTICPPLG
jgi:hypothetical protein